MRLPPRSERCYDAQGRLLHTPATPALERAESWRERRAREARDGWAEYIQPKTWKWWIDGGYFRPRKRS